MQPGGRPVRPLDESDGPESTLVAADGEYAPHLDEADPHVRAALRDRDRLALVLHLDHAEAADHLLGLGEGTVRHDGLALGEAHASPFLLGMEGRAAAHLAFRR